MKPLFALLALALALSAGVSEAADKRPDNLQSTVEQINGEPQGGQAVSVSSTKATETGLTAGRAYLVTCTVATSVLPGSDVTTGTDGTAGVPIPANVPFLVLLKTATSLSFITSSASGTCIYNRLD